METRYYKRLDLAYKFYVSLYDVIKLQNYEMSYVARTLGQLIYNKFGKKMIGISERAKSESQENLTEDHFNNCQKVGEYLAKSRLLSRDEFEKIVVESRKTIKVTKKENSLLRKFQKNKEYGTGMEAYEDAGINVLFY